jgi:isopentenyl-diphosphate delta-isomerase
MTETDQRKEDHIQICLEEKVQAQLATTGLEDVHLIHRCLPEISFETIQLTTPLFDHILSAPIIIEAMTGGTEKSAHINAVLAEAAEKFNIAMGVGSQRVAIENPDTSYSFAIVRERAPNAFIIANIGGPQLREYTLAHITRAIDMIKANALMIHLNALQESIQPEGEPQYTGLLEKIQQLATSISIPVLIKETGAGIAYEEALKLQETGIQGLDVAGAGGTSWSAVETHRAKLRNDIMREHLGKTFWDWGIPTAVSIVEARTVASLTIIGSGGLRTGLDVAKVIALGAEVAGLAQPLLKASLTNEVKTVIERVLLELKTAMFLIGAQSIPELQSSPLVIMGKTAQWLRARGFDINRFARRTYK